MSVDVATGLATYVVFVGSTTLHEAAHATVALLGGDRTAYAGGQVSLNPVPHMRREPFGMVVLPLLGAVVTGFPIGYASTPYSPGWAYAFPRRAALMSLAGPAANFTLMLLGLLALGAGVALGVFGPPREFGFAQLVSGSNGFWHAMSVFLSVTVTLNMLLGVFNLIPVPPLDGSGAVGLFLSRETANRWQHMIWTNRHLSMVGIVVAWIVIDRLFWPVAVVVLAVFYRVVGISP
jgi:Zn-dependent protease